MAREYISLVERTSDEATIEVEIRPKIDNALGDEVVAARKAVHELDERQREVAALPRAPAKDRAESGLSVTSPGLMGGGEQDAALTNTDANLPATPAVGQGPRNTWEQSIDLPSRTQPTPISVNDGSSRFDRWPGECIHASITAAGVAAALLRFSAAVVPDAQSAMTPPSGACVSSAFPIKADARCRAAACAHVEPPSVGRPLARRTSLVSWTICAAYAAGSRGLTDDVGDGRAIPGSLAQPASAGRPTDSVSAWNTREKARVPAHVRKDPGLSFGCVSVSGCGL